LDHAHHPVATSLRFLRPRPPPPSSTLFPYTTLFRSVIGLLNSGIACFYYLRLLAAVYTKAGTESARLNQVRPISVPAAVELGSGDRKSTRLNSSHLVISYAVFCLKKKKYYQTFTRRKDAIQDRVPSHLCFCLRPFLVNVLYLFSSRMRNTTRLKLQHSPLVRNNQP